MNTTLSNHNGELFVSVVVPAMNESGNIQELCELFAEMFAEASFPGELILVNDGSTDDTLKKIREQASRYSFIRVCSHARNRGLTAALQTGFSAACGNVYVFYPADLQFLPEDIPAMIDKIREGADVVTGWKQGKYKKRFVSSIYNALSRMIFRTKVHDLNSVKAFRSEIVERMFLRRDWHRYIVVMAAEEGYVIDEVKVTLHPRQWGDSKFTSFWRIPIGILDMLAVKFQISFLKKPLILFGAAAGFCFLLSALTAIYAFYERYVLGVGNRAYLFLIMLLAGVGLGFFILGLLAEALTGIREEIGATRESLLAIVRDRKESQATESKNVSD
jgi:glycosyltransferase involved in cell wall biosynthesis